MYPLQTDPVVFKIVLTIIAFLIIPTVGGVLIMGELQKWAAELVAKAEQERREER